jgi:hypothetical protein
MDLKDAKVLVGTPNYMNMFWSEVHTNHIESAVEWKEQGINFNWMIVGRSFVHFARTQICDVAVRGGYTHILWVDDDAIIPSGTLKKFIEHDKDVVIAPYPMRKAPHEIGVLSSEVGDFHDHGSYRNWTPKDLNKGLVECDGGGTHVMLVKVSALTDIFGPAGQKADFLTDNESLQSEDQKGCPYFVMPKQGTEDMYFCYRLKCKGGEIWCDTDVFAPHVGFAPIVRKEHSEYYAQDREGAKSLEQHNNIPVLQVRKGDSHEPKPEGHVSSVREPKVDSSRPTSLV